MASDIWFALRRIASTQGGAGLGLEIEIKTALALALCAAAVVK
jgi:hypothetical protein